MHELIWHLREINGKELHPLSGGKTNFAVILYQAIVFWVISPSFTQPLYKRHEKFDRIRRNN